MNVLSVSPNPHSRNVLGEVSLYRLDQARIAAVATAFHPFATVAFLRKARRRHRRKTKAGLMRNLSIRRRYSKLRANRNQTEPTKKKIYSKFLLLPSPHFLFFVPLWRAAALFFFFISIQFACPTLYYPIYRRSLLVFPRFPLPSKIGRLFSFFPFSLPSFFSACSVGPASLPWVP
jgi:hypothetical protein